MECGGWRIDTEVCFEVVQEHREERWCTGAVLAAREHTRGPWWPRHKERNGHVEDFA